MQTVAAMGVVQTVAAECAPQANHATSAALLQTVASSTRPLTTMLLLQGPRPAFDAAVSALRTTLNGATSALIASPCASPVLASLLAFVAQSGRPAVGAGAGAVTTSGKIDWGHLTGDVRQMGGKAYDLVVDDAVLPVDDLDHEHDLALPEHIPHFLAFAVDPARCRCLLLRRIASWLCSDT